MKHQLGKSSVPDTAKIGEEAENDRFEIAGGVWLITPMLRDAKAGRFGAPIILPIEDLDPASFSTCGVDREKVERFKAKPTVLSQPALISQHDGGSIVLDGRHRLTAIQEIGWPSFSAWSVPWALVGHYMLHPGLVMDASVAILAARSHEEALRTT